MSLLGYVRVSDAVGWLCHLGVTYLFEVVRIETNASGLKQNAPVNWASLRVKAV